MSVNNFKELERIETSALGNPPEQVKKNIAYNMSLFRFIGDLIELYLPHFGRALIKMSGENTTQPRSKYPNKD
jgi:hypothetical protein